eukprot:GILI01003579.1.p1 GENE.GILI01003579.1~~GILI01003579.1.p1  ORF type:complete len:1222 (+),score=320.97 GILI01003579.1:333-3668(+)
MKREYFIGSREAHENRELVQAFVQEFNSLPVVNGDVLAMWSGAGMGGSSLRGPIADVRAELDTISSIISGPLAATDVSSLLALVKTAREKASTLDQLISALAEHSISAANRYHSLVSTTLSHLVKDYVKKMKVKYADAADDTYIRRNQQYIRESKEFIDALLSDYSAKAVSRTVFQDLARASSTLGVTLNQLHGAVLRNQAALESNREMCLESETFRKALIEGQLKPKFENDPDWAAVMSEAEARQTRLNDLREGNDLERRQFENPSAASRVDGSKKFIIEKAKLLLVAQEYLAAVEESAMFLQVSINSATNYLDSVRSGFKTAVKRCSDAYKHISTFYSSGKREVDPEDVTKFKRAMAKLKLAVALEKALDLYEQWAIHQGPLDVSMVTGLVEKWQRWLKAQQHIQSTSTLSAIKDDIEILRTESLKLYTHVMRLFNPSRANAVVQAVQSVDSSIKQADVERHVADPSALYNRLLVLFKESSDIIDSTSAGWLFTEYRAARYDLYEKHLAAMEKAKADLEPLTMLGQIVDSAKKSLSDTLHIRAINTLKRAALSDPFSAGFRPIFIEPDHERYALHCFSGPWYANLKRTAESEDDFIDCAMLTDFSATSGKISESFMFLDMELQARVDRADSAAALMDAFSESMSRGGSLPIDTFLKKAKALRIDKGFFGPIISKFSLLERERFTPARFYPRDHAHLVITMSRSGATAAERKLSTMNAALQHLYDRYEGEPALTNEMIKLRRQPVLVKWHGEAGIDVGGLRAEFFSSTVDALMMPEGGLVKNTPFGGVRFVEGTQAEVLRRARLLGFAMAWCYFNRVSLTLKLPLVYYHQLRHVARSRLGTAVYPDENVDYTTSLLLELQGVPEYRDSLIPAVPLRYGDNCGAKEEHLQLYCAAQSLFLPDFEIPPEMSRFDVMEAVSSSVQAATNIAIKAHLYSAALTGSTQVIQAWADSFLSLFTPEELPALAYLRIDELRTAFGSLPAIDIDHLKPLVQISGEGLSQDKKTATTQASATTTIKAFWELMKRWTPEQRKLTVEFWTGQSNVPHDLELGKWTIYLYAQGREWKYPVAHTCFFNMELSQCPREFSLEQCVEKLSDNFIYAWTTIGRFELR